MGLSLSVEKSGSAAANRSCRKARQAMAFCSALFGTVNIALNIGGTGDNAMTSASKFIPTVVLIEQQSQSHTTPVKMDAQIVDLAAVE